MTTSRRAQLVRFGVSTFLRFRAVGGLERAMVLAAQAFVAVIPLLVVTVALMPGESAGDVGDRVVERFDLTGAVADTVRELFAPAGDVTGGTTVLGAALLLVSGYTFSRRVQGLYQTAWELAPAGLREAWRPLAWLMLLAAYLSLIPVVRGVEPGHRLLAGAASFVLWLVTPYLLLAGRVAWRRLLATAALTALGMALMSGWSTIYMSRAIESSTERFGLIGAAFAVVSWLVAVGFVLVLAAALGATVAARGAPPERRG